MWLRLQDESIRTIWRRGVKKQDFCVVWSLVEKNNNNKRLKTTMIVWSIWLKKQQHFSFRCFDNIMDMMKKSPKHNSKSKSNKISSRSRKKKFANTSREFNFHSLHLNHLITLVKFLKERRIIFEDNHLGLLLIDCWFYYYYYYYHSNFSNIFN